MPRNPLDDAAPVADPAPSTALVPIQRERPRASGRRVARPPAKPRRTSTKLWLLLGGAAVTVLCTSALLASTLNSDAPVVRADVGTSGFSSDPFAGASDARQVLDSRTRLGAVQLRTDDLAMMTAFYTQGVGLEVLDDSATEVSLGSGGVELLVLTTADLPAPVATDAGLYYTAIRFPDAAGLAAQLSTITELAPETYVSSFDRGVSEDFYFADPDGNGVVLTVDRPSDQWQWKNGRVQLDDEPLDPTTFIADTTASGAVAAGGPDAIGNIALRVGNLAIARAFYVDTLGLDVTVDEGGGTLAMSAGGYHHLLTVTSTTSSGVGVRPESLGLQEFTLHLGDSTALAAAATRFADAGIAVDRTDSVDGSFRVNDPWGNTLSLTAS